MKKSEINTNLRRLRPLLSSSDPAQVKQGVALIEALGDPTLIDKLLETVYASQARRRKAAPDAELRSYSYTGLSRDQLLKLIRLGTGKRAAAVREMITAISVDGEALATLSGLTSLETLTITGALPDDGGAVLAGLPALRDLRLRSSPLRSLAFLPATLTALAIERCSHGILDIPDLQLDTLTISTPEPTLSGSLGGCRVLKLHLSAVEQIGALSGGERLEHLEADGSGGALPLGGLADLLAAAPLRHLKIGGCASSGLCALLPKLHALEVLEARSCHHLTDLRQLSPEAPLQKMDLRSSQLKSLDGLGSRPSLWLIRLEHATHLNDVSALAGAPALRLVMLSKTALTPSHLPESVRWAGTWLSEPDIEVLSTRSLPPDR